VPAGAGVRNRGFVDGGYLAKEFGFSQGSMNSMMPMRDRRQLIFVRQWLDQHAADRFFLFIHCYDVHSPYRPPPPFDTVFEDSPTADT
jgi:hypothetical protein